MFTYEWALVLGIPAAWIGLFLLYCVRVALHGRYRVARLETMSESLWLPRPLMEFGYWLYQAPVRGLHRLGVTANMLTLATMPLAMVAAVLIAGGRFGLGGWVLLLSLTLDVFDGMVARLQGTSGESGGFLDATMDRYVDLISFSGFLFYYRDQSFSMLLVLAAMLGSMQVSYVRARGETLGITAEIGYMRRYERAVWLGAGTVLAPIGSFFLEPNNAHPTYHITLVVMALMAILSNLTAVLRILYVLRLLTQRKTVAGEPTDTEWESNHAG